MKNNNEKQSVVRGTAAIDPKVVLWLESGMAGGLLPALPLSSRIIVKNFGFDPAEITVPAGTEVEWTDQGGRHSVQADDGSIKS